jgi:NAD(P)H-dependent FMN reductase
MAKPVLQVIIGSTRPGRVGRPIGEWFAELAREDGRFEVQLVDLAEVDLPIFDEEHHPIMENYTHDHTKKWSETVAQADAFVWVVPEYNHSFNAATKNAIDYLSKEWRYKPAGFVSYGGISAGTRAVQALKTVFSALKMTPIPEAVAIPLGNYPIIDGTFTGDEGLNASAQLMLGELDRWCQQLKELR